MSARDKIVAIGLMVMASIVAYCLMESVFRMQDKNPSATLGTWIRRQLYRYGYLAERSGMISSSVGLYRAYRMPQVIRHVKDGQLTFWAVGHADGVLDLLESIPAVGKKAAMGWGIVDRWEVKPCDEDYTVMHPRYGLMRPMPVEEMTLTGYPIMEYAVKPPYWKAANRRLCYVPIGGGAQ